MARILALSSQVVRGAVGLSLAVPALQALGHEVLALPTVLMSNHPGHPLAERISLAPAQLGRLLDALEKNGWLAGLDAVLTGYLPTCEHVDLACNALRHVRAVNANALLLADPVIGDDPKGLYIAADAAAAIRDRLLGEADLATPNRFELAYLAGRPVTGPDEAARALDCLPCGGGLATSVPTPQGVELMNILSFRSTFAATKVTRHATAPHGTGDLMSALLTGMLVDGIAPARALAAATAAVDRALRAAAGRDALDPAALPAALLELTWPVTTFAARVPRGSDICCPSQHAPEQMSDWEHEGSA